MTSVTVLGKDWGFFASALSDDLEQRGFRVRRRFTQNEFLHENGKDASSQAVNYLRRKFRAIKKPLWVYRFARRVGNFLSMVWWVTGIGGSKVIVVSGIPSIFQTKTFMSLCLALGKQVVLCVHGTDARPPFLNGLFFEESRRLGEAKFAQFIEGFEKKVAHAVSKSTAVISWMGTSHFIPGDVFLFEETGFPVRNRTPSEWLRVSLGRQSHRAPTTPFRVLHAPSSVGKGSSEIKRAIEELVAMGYPFELTELKNVSNSEVKKAIANSDLVVDQLYSDNFAGILAREAADLNRFVIVGGSSLHLMNPNVFELPPVLVGSVEALKTELIWCFENQEKLPQKAEKLRLHFERRNFAEFFTNTFITHGFDAGATLELQSRRPFSDFHPGFGGYGPETEIQEMIRSLVQNADISVLRLPKTFADELLAHHGISLDD